MPSEKNYTKKADGTTLIGRPRSTNEILINDESKGSMPNNEKDASTFPLSTLKAMISALKSMYKDIDEKLLSKMLTK